MCQAGRCMVYRVSIPPPFDCIGIQPQYWWSGHGYPFFWPILQWWPWSLHEPTRGKCQNTTMLFFIRSLCAPENLRVMNPPSQRMYVLSQCGGNPYVVRLSFVEAIYMDVLTSPNFFLPVLFSIRWMILLERHFTGQWGTCVEVS